MKSLNRLALATAVAAVPLASHAELKALDEHSMSNVTGQSGVTIELETQVSVDTVTYTDEGELNLSDIQIGGRDDTAGQAGVDGKLDNLKIDIDVAGDGDALIKVASTETDGSGNAVPIDFGASIGSASLDATDGSGDSTLLASNIGLEGEIAQLDLQVDTATDELQVESAFKITDMDATIDFLGVTIEDVEVTGASTFGNPDPNEASDPLNGEFVRATRTISKVSGVGSSNGDGLSIKTESYISDTRIGAIKIGGDSIGEISMDNMKVIESEMVIYGH
ncbi:hypothetical protein CF392_15140 [Tamilnaduibacter salinus]|uniref:DUF6160 domain-containing protein n=1 Tax=Tamilnaduibacter salinus TaxID=1484056 RepID=A0A2A2I0F4_9GAMM|nr:DUF6160 family protein [Tamilnaduibacter salinus]PAV24625.1 hypothetical protein CF392_15140 [Tamilnaduibacter salinus]